MAGRTILAKSTLSSIPTHIMYYIKLLRKIHEHISTMQRDFFCGSCMEKRKIHLLSWDTFTIPKDRRGLGLHRSEIRNRAIHANLA